jgi:hypothetical protein
MSSHFPIGGNGAPVTNQAEQATTTSSAVDVALSPQEIEMARMFRSWLDSKAIINTTIRVQEATGRPVVPLAELEPSEPTAAAHSARVPPKPKKRPVAIETKEAVLDAVRDLQKERRRCITAEMVADVIGYGKTSTYQFLAQLKRDKLLTRDNIKGYRLAPSV